MTQNVVDTYKKIFNLSRGLKDMSQKADFEREHMVAHSCHILKKVA